jgi:mRNA interferase HicA
MLIIIHVDKRCEVIMKHKKFIDELKGLGVVLVDGTNHYKAYYNGKQTVVVRHPVQEYSKRYMELIKKQLGIK